jgi:hypothetical protein
MMSRYVTVAALVAATIVAALPASPAQAELAGADRDRIVSLAQRMAADPAVLEAVRAQNAKKVAMPEIMKVQADWKAGKTPDLVRALMTNTCAKRMAELQKAEKSIVEVAVHDNQGVRVCVTNKTSNYYRGDKAKFTDAFKNGQGAIFVSRPEYDASSQEYTTEISVPVMDGGRAVGVVGLEVITKKR